MNREDYNKAINLLSEVVNQNINKKNDEYADDQNTLQHFEKGGKKRGISREKMLLNWATKHDISIDDIVEKAERGEYARKEVLDEKIGDMITYYTILYASLLDRLKETQPKAIGTKPPLF